MSQKADVTYRYWFDIEISRFEEMKPVIIQHKLASMQVWSLESSLSMEFMNHTIDPAVGALGNKNTKF